MAVVFGVLRDFTLSNRVFISGPVPMNLRVLYPRYFAHCIYALTTSVTQASKREILCAPPSPNNQLTWILPERLVFGICAFSHGFRELYKKSNIHITHVNQNYK